MSVAMAGQREPLSRRTFDPVRRNSRAAGSEGLFWTPVQRKAKWKILRAADALDRRDKAAGKRNGPLGYIALKVLDQLLRLVDHRSGRLDPAMSTLAELTRLSKSAVVAALARLEANGFLFRLRRFVDTGQRGVRGPQVQQTSNAYRLELPAAAAALLPKDAPPPEDFEAARAARAAELYAIAEAGMIEAIEAKRLARFGRNASRPRGLNPTSDLSITSEKESG